MVRGVGPWPPYPLVGPSLTCHHRDRSNATGYQTQSFLINLGSNISIDKYKKKKNKTKQNKKKNKFRSRSIKKFKKKKKITS